uniref:Tudor domain-containing protein n=1 Tax=Strongyloides papillosus TaxID=174720 RepID=A0A0N5C045_STREA
MFPSDEYFKQTLSCFAGVESCDIKNDIHFYVAKCDVDVWASYDRRIKEEDDELNYNFYENVLIDERYLHIKNVKTVYSDLDCADDVLEDMEIMPIFEGLSKMQNLLAFKIDFCIRPESFDNSILFCVLNGNFNNIRPHAFTMLRSARSEKAFQDISQILKTDA